jgi:hypothetical protein
LWPVCNFLLFFRPSCNYSPTAEIKLLYPFEPAPFKKKSGPELIVKSKQCNLGGWDLQTKLQIRKPPLTNLQVRKQKISGKRKGEDRFFDGRPRPSPTMRSAMDG